MSLAADLKSLTRPQKSAIWASYLGWTLDAFDFFLLVFMLSAIAAEFGTDVRAVSVAIFLTLAARPFGAFFFGLLAERFGRRPILMIVILAFSAFSALSGLARSLSELLLIRVLFGFAMGGEWGIGASLVMETIPARLRGPSRACSRAAIRRAISSPASSLACCSTRSAGAACSSSGSRPRCSSS